MSHRDRLLILPSLRGYPGSDGSIVLTRKFVDGVLEYVKLWQGDVMVCVRPTNEAGTNLDQCEVHPSDLPFSLDWIPDTESQFTGLLSEAGLVLASLAHEHTSLATICRDIDVPLVYVSEYSLNTRRQIIRGETTNPILRWRRERWATKCEKHFEKAIPIATGIQCNGTPTYNAYRILNSNSLLYFDTRVRESELASETTINNRVCQMMNGGPIRLAFSGRLIKMKGADQLPYVARELKSRGVPFTMNICGGGELENQIRRDIQQFDLLQEVRLRGVLGFQNELMPFIANEVDLFVCCHPQGDPSCTYLETMSCGVPIVGYANEAFQGIVKSSDTGWLTPISCPGELADQIDALNKDREALANAAIATRRFAGNHTFEKTMESRVAHMRSCMAAANSINKTAVGVS